MKNEKMNLHKMEPWLAESKTCMYNLSESGFRNLTYKDIFEKANISVKDLLSLSLDDMDTKGSENLRKEISKIYNNISTKQILVTTGTSEAILLFFMQMKDEKVDVIYFSPVFQTLIEIPKFMGLQLKEVKLKETNNYRINYKELDKIIDDNRTTVIIINSPHNPTGMVINDYDIFELKKLKEEHNNIIYLFDEHYRFINSNNEITDSLLFKVGEGVATGSMIKCFGCVGLRIGWIIDSEQNIEMMRNLKDYTTHSLNSSVDYISTELLKSQEKFLSENNSTIIENINCFDKIVNRNSNILTWIKPEGGIVGFPRFKNIKNCTKLIKRLLEEESVSLLPGYTFEQPDSFRICFGLEKERFTEAMLKFEQFINRNLEG